MQPHVLLGGSLSHWEAQRLCVLSCPSLAVGRRSLVPPALGGCLLPGIIFSEGVLSQWAWTQRVLGQEAASAVLGASLPLFPMKSLKASACAWLVVVQRLSQGQLLITCCDFEFSACLPAWRGAGTGFCQPIGMANRMSHPSWHLMTCLGKRRFHVFSPD